MVSNADDPAWNVCPADDGYAALTVPCHRRDEYTDAEMAAMIKPTGNAWVTTWLEEEFGERSEGFDLLWLIPIISGALAVFVGGGVGWFYWRKRTRKPGKGRYDLEDSGLNYLDGGTPVLALVDQVPSGPGSTWFTSASTGVPSRLRAPVDRAVPAPTRRSRFCLTARI
ncbi:hypothetical protein PR002_g20584 [Phytophthora rubi]|uniref:Uncharacterized protein n=1 Tax=Phytophthora rubi TaxID=129364 RepID=A0A6A3JDL4_9STRA|nr:hypothetical protein PR002_g20584 [Phytophthora rubi]